MQTDVGTIETDLLGGKVKKSLRSKRSGRQDARTTSWKNHFATPEKQAMVKVDSTAIAESMLQNQTHFLDEAM